MKFTDLIKKSVLEGFSYTDISTTKILVVLGIAFALSMYIHLVYKLVTKNEFYYKSYGICMTLMAVVTAGIILAMQSSLVISLGMVGALSIVRFRTAIKDPMDLLFLFWSIATGIICGAGLFELAICVALATTVGILLFHLLPVKNDAYLLVINAASANAYEKIQATMQRMNIGFAVKSKNISTNRMDLILEVKLKNKETELLNALMAIEQVDSVQLLENDVNVKA